MPSSPFFSGERRVSGGSSSENKNLQLTDNGEATRAMKLKVKQQVIPICAQVLRVTVLTARWRPVLESLFRCSPAESLTLSLSLSFLSTFLVSLSVAFILPSLSFPSQLCILLRSPFSPPRPSRPPPPPPPRSFARSRRHLNFFTSMKGGKWNKMKKGGKNLNVGLHRRVGEVVPSSTSSPFFRARRSSYPEHSILYPLIFNRSVF